MIRAMGYYRDGVPVTVDGLSDAVFDTPHVAEARQALKAARDTAVADPGAFVWVGLFQPTKAELAAVESIFELDPLQVEDAGNGHQRAKVDLEGERSFIVLKVLTFVPEAHQVEVGQVAVFIGPSYLVTVRHGTTRDLRSIRDRLLHDEHVLRHGPIGVLHTIADFVVDGYLLVGEQVQDEVENLEERVFSPRGEDLSAPIYMLKRENLEIRRAVGPLVGIANSLARETLSDVPDSLLDSFRDLGEHLLRAWEQAEATDTLLLALMAAANSKIDLQQSSDQRRIAAWAALALVPTVIASLYGMNFVFMPELQWQYGYPLVLLVIAAAVGVLFRTLRRSGWL
jgi:magnesium transporter